MPEPTALKTQHEKAISELHHSLGTKLVDAQEFGFTIKTTFGDIPISPKDAVSFLPLLNHILRRQLLELYRL